MKTNKYTWSLVLASLLMASLSMKAQQGAIHIDNLKFSLAYDSATGIGQATCDGPDDGITTIENLVIPSYIEYEGSHYPVTSIANFAFYKNRGITLSGTLTLSEELVEIGNNAFANNSELTGKLVIPNSVAIIGDGAFSSCPGFTGTLDLPEGLTDIGGDAFFKCAGFTGVLRIPDNVTHIGPTAFYECEGFTALDLGNGVQQIENAAFSNCTGFKGTLIIPSSVYFLGELAFNQCYGITSLSLPESLTTITSQAFHMCTGLTSLEIPNTVQSIESQAFSGCDNLSGTLVIPASVQTIGIQAFSTCDNITDLILGSGLTDIESLAFSGCRSLKTVTCEALDPPIAADNAFYNLVYPVAILYVPASSIDYYKEAEVWKEFRHINPIGMVPATRITLGEKEVRLKVGETYQLKATVYPEDATDPVIWTSNNPGMASVSEEGLITALSVTGEEVAVITARCGDVFAECYVTVDPVEAESITLNVTSLNMVEGDKTSLSYSIYPENVTDPKVTWSSSNPRVASVDDGEVTALSKGEAIITVSCGNVSATCTVTVASREVETITLNAENIDLRVGESFLLKATVYPEDNDDDLVWTVNEEGVVILYYDGEETAGGRSMLVNAVSEGTRVIRVECGNAYATCQVNVLPLEVEDVKMNVENLTIHIGETAQLSYTYSPANATNPEVYWGTYDSMVARVNQDGLVTAYGLGETVVYVTVGGVMAECHVTVVPVEATEIVLNETEISILVNESFKLTATVYPENVTDKYIVWSSQNENIVMVVSDGTVYGMQEGSVYVYATCGEASARCRVNVVRPRVEYIDIPGSIDLEVGYEYEITPRIYPEYGLYGKKSWSSDNEKVAYVYENSYGDGVVVAQSPGDARITFAVDSLSVYCDVHVYTNSYLYLHDYEVTMLTGQTKKLQVSADEYTLEHNMLEWYTSDRDVATVDSEGVVSAVGPGKCVITVRNTFEADSCNVYVLKRPYAPDALMWKGDGTSHTLVALMSLPDSQLEEDGYSYIFGYTDPSTGYEYQLNYYYYDLYRRYYIVTDQSVFNNPDLDYWVYAQSPDNYGNMIPSARRHMNGDLDENFGEGYYYPGDTRNTIDTTAVGMFYDYESTGRGSVTVYSLTGQILLNKNFEAGEKISKIINREKLAKGTYIVTVKTAEGTDSQKIVIR